MQYLFVLCLEVCTGVWLHLQISASYQKWIFQRFYSCLPRCCSIACESKVTDLGLLNSWKHGILQSGTVNWLWFRSVSLVRRAYAIKRAVYQEQPIQCLLVVCRADMKLAQNGYFAHHTSFQGYPLETQWDSDLLAVIEVWSSHCLLLTSRRTCWWRF